MTEKDKRTVIPSNRIITLLLKHAQLNYSSASWNDNKFTIGAYRNGMGSVYMIMTTEYHDNYWDIIPRHLVELHLYKTDCTMLHKKGFKLCAWLDHDDEENSEDEENSMDEKNNI